MGSPKFEIGGIGFPISKTTRFAFEVMPMKSGGTLVRHRGKAVVDVLHDPSLSNRAKKIRIDVQNVLGRGKRLIIQQDVVSIGDQIYKLASQKPGKKPTKAPIKGAKKK